MASDLNTAPFVPEAKPPADPNDLKEIQDAWNAREKMPLGPKRDKYEAAVRAVHADLMAKHDAPVDPDGIAKDVGGRVLGAIDYVPGIARTAAMSAASAIAGHGDMVADHAKQDWSDAAIPGSGKLAPSVGEWMERNNIPEGPHLSDLPAMSPVAAAYGAAGSSVYTPDGEGMHLKKGGMLDPSLRGLVGGAADLVLNPRTLAELGEKGLAKLGLAKATPTSLGEQMADTKAATIEKVLDRTAPAQPLLNPRQKLQQKLLSLMDPAGAALQKGGKALHDSVYADADAANATVRQPPVSDVAMRNGIWGSARARMKQLQDLVSNNSSDVSGTVNEYADFDPNAGMRKKDLLRTARRRLDYAEKNVPGQQEIAPAVQARVNEDYFPGAKGKDVLNIQQLDEARRTAQKQARIAGGFTPEGGLPKNPVRGVKKAVENEVSARADAQVGTAARQGIENILDDAVPGLGGGVHLANRDSSAVLSAQKEMAKRAQMMATVRRSLTPLAAGTGAGLLFPGMGGQDHQYAAPLIGALAGGAMASDAFRTGLGQLAYKYGIPAANLGRAAGVENYGPMLREDSPWEKLRKSVEKKDE